MWEETEAMNRLQDWRQPNYSRQLRWGNWETNVWASATVQRKSGLEQKEKQASAWQPLDKVRVECATVESDAFRRYLYSQAWTSIAGKCAKHEAF